MLGPALVTVAVGGCLAVLGVGVFLFGDVEASRVTSPDGAFVAVTTYRRFEAFVPRGPGGGSDKPGRLELFRVSDGRSCGSAPLSMVWMANELTWALTATPRSASAAMTSWNLDTCRVD